MSSVQDVLNDGQQLAVFPAKYIEPITSLVLELFPQHTFACLGGSGNVTLFVYPRLSDEELQRWNRAFEATLQRLEKEA